ncbi:acetolactate decarboxylase [Erwinia mallotivora]|uniref:acetolactate decarboxylase n=1 Tax=Erwinia mallotivora TaxID=69222 RepID=UPI0021BF093D|nr:acetolactate decarboxylase [Erwinia mallotivora]
MSKITQFSTIGALMAGHFDGECDTRQFTMPDAFGLGCSANINGELTIYQGVFWEATANEAIHHLHDYHVPFIQLTDFNPEKKFSVEAINQDCAAKLLGEHVVLDNIFLAICIEANFDRLVIRRPQRAEETERDIHMVADAQQEYTLTDVNGKLIGFWTPELFGRISVPGFHFHFLDTVTQQSGHVLSYSARNATVSFEVKPTIEITNPHSEKFKELVIDLSAMDQIIAKVER